METTSKKDFPHSNGHSKKSPISLTKSEPVHIFPAGEKPSPKGLYALSNLDQMFPFYIETMFVFEKTNNNNNACEVLKESLSKALEEFYPLAGVMDVTWDGKMVVDCSGGENGGGVPFVRAFCDEEMAVAVGDIMAMDMELANSLYIAHAYQAVLGSPSLAVQVTRFKCGGVILGVRFNHALIDGRAFTDFMLSWCQITKSQSPSTIHPHLDRSILSPRNPPQITQYYSHTEYSKSKAPLVCLSYNHKHNSITKSFTFTPKHLSTLKQLSLTTQNNPNKSSLNSTRFELISAWIWICWTKANKVDPTKTTQMLTAVDVRSKFNPPLPEYYFGNGIAAACAKAKASDITSGSFCRAVGVVQEALREVTESYARSEIDYIEVMRKPLESENTVWITKWTRLPFYEVDFAALGGKPTQVGPASLIDNLVVCVPERKESENLVVSLSLPDHVMERFQEVIMEMELN